MATEIGLEEMSMLISTCAASALLLTDEEQEFVRVMQFQQATDLGNYSQADAQRLKKLAADIEARSIG